MSDLADLFSRDPLSYTKEGGEVDKIIEALRSQRHLFKLGNMSAGSAKPKKKTATAAAAEKLSLDDITL